MNHANPVVECDSPHPCGVIRWLTTALFSQIISMGPAGKRSGWNLFLRVRPKSFQALTAALDYNGRLFARRVIRHWLLLCHDRAWVGCSSSGIPGLLGSCRATFRLCWCASCQPGRCRYWQPFPLEAKYLTERNVTQTYARAQKEELCFG